MLRTPRVPEKAVQVQIVTLLRSIGARVYVLGTTRRRGDYHGTMQTEGLPDLLAFLPAKAGHAPRLLAVEVKAAGGRARPEQLIFRDCCEATGVAHVLGDLDALFAWLIAEGYLRRDNVGHYHQPAGDRHATRA